MKTILVSGASGIVGYGILRSLRHSSEKYKLIGTTIYSDSVAPAFCDIFEQAPLTEDECYSNWLCEIVDKYNVDMIIPGIEADMFKWAEMKEKLDKTCAKVLLNNLELIELCGDKWSFFKKINKFEPNITIDTRLSGSFEEFAQIFGVPFLLKPRSGFASKGIVKVESKEIFSKYQNDLGNKLMVQPIVGCDDDEYTVSAFFDNSSRLCCFMSLRRKLSKEGFTRIASVVNLEGVEEILESLASILKPVGPTNFQFRKELRNLKLLEINPRVSSSTSIRTAFGFNETVMSVNYFLNSETPRQPLIKGGIAIRYVEEYIFYDRDNF